MAWSGISGASFGAAPTLFTKMSIRPNFSVVFLTNSKISFGSVASPGIDIAFPPFLSMSLAVREAVSSLYELTMTVAPSAAKPSTIALPIPRPAADTSAILSFNFI